jgi:hypothetical protein
MPMSFDGTPVPERLPMMNCGGTPEWDYPSQMSYRCDTCMAVIGSIAQPNICKIVNSIKEGKFYNWKHQSERLVYLGHNFSGNGYWHQFAKVELPEVVWSECTSRDLLMIEETNDE